MFSISGYSSPSQKELRSFGLILAACFAVLGLAGLLRGHPIRVWALAVSTVFLTAALLLPSGLRWPHRWWMALGAVLGWINTRILLGAIFYAVVTPIRVCMKIAGRDLLNRKFDKTLQSYRVVREPRPASHMKNQF